MGKLQYPKARRVEQVDVYHGVQVEDPFRWMENLEDPDLAPWLDDQTRLTEKLLGSIPCRERFRERIGQLSRTSVVGRPIARGSRWFQFGIPEGFERPAVFVSPDPTEQGRLLFDSNQLNGRVATFLLPSPDGSLLLWGESVGGSDWVTWRLVEVETGRAIEDAVEDCKLWATWLPDSKGFLYQAFPSEETQDRRRSTFNPQLKLHRIGNETQQDELVYEDSESPHYFFPSVSDDGRFLIITPIMTPGSPVIYAELGNWDFEVLTSVKEQMWFFGSRGEEFLFTTTAGAAFGRVVAVDRGRPEPDSWRTVVPERDCPLLPYSCDLTGNWVVAVHDYLGRSSITVHDLLGEDAYDVELPYISRVAESGDLSEPFGVSPDGQELYFTVTSPSSPSTLISHNLTSRETQVVSRAEGASDLEIEAEVLWAHSADGTSVPMTFIRKARMETESPPIVIEGYGGGGSIMRPYDFSPWKVAWLEAGGAVATAHLRGGRELGDEWYAAAKRGGKLKAMEDFIACAEACRSLTAPDRIGITGRSSGGMLAAAAAIARPDLFAACVPEVGMFDPLRYHLFGLGRLMVDEYGISEVPEDFEAMYRYSPLHNIVSGTKYPAMLLTVHTDDDRVAPGGPFKFAATLQSAPAGSSPVLLRMQSGAGHFLGAASNVDERADILSFLGAYLGLRACRPEGT